MQIASSIKQRLSEPENVEIVTSLLASEQGFNRRRLAQEICLRLGLKDPKGDLQTATTSKALRDLQDAGLWTLPKPFSSTPRTWNATRLNKPVPPPTSVPGVVAEIMGLCLIEVTDPEHLRIWNELMIREHPLKECRLVGRQFRYLIGSDHGWLGGIGFGSAALQLQGRDDWIGWNHQQRLEHLPRVLNMSRYLIRPSVRCPHLASHVLALCARRLADDFQRRYSLRPWLLESFVEIPAYGGICYQAANWIPVG